MKVISNYQSFKRKYERNDTNQNVLTCLSRYSVKHPNGTYKIDASSERSPQRDGMHQNESYESHRRRYNHCEYYHRVTHTTKDLLEEQRKLKRLNPKNDLADEA